MITTNIKATLPLSEGFRTNTLTQAVFEFRSKFPKAIIESINGEKFNGLDEQGNPILGNIHIEDAVVIEDLPNEAKLDTGASTTETEEGPEGEGAKGEIVSEKQEAPKNLNGQDKPKGKK